MIWTHPVDRPGASQELKLLIKASFLVAGAAERTPVGTDIDAPQWAWDVIETGRQRYPGYSWDTLMCTEWCIEKSAAFAAAKAAEEAAAEAFDTTVAAAVAAHGDEANKVSPDFWLISCQLC